MAYQFADGFDNYGNNYVMTSGYPWTFTQGMTTSNTDYRFAPPGSLPGGCLYTSGTQQLVRQSMSGNLSTIILGFGVKFAALPGSGVQDFCDFWDSGGCQCCLTVNSNGALQFYRGNGSTLGGSFGPTANGAVGAISANATITAGAWYGIAVQVTVATGTSGAVAAYVNGSPTAAISSTGINTSGDGNSYANQVSVGSMTQNIGVMKFDDFYCFDTTGATQNSLLGGDARILTKMPASAGNYTNWTPAGLANNWANAAVQPPNTTDYNLNNTPGTIDSYTMQVASLGVAPYFVLARASLTRDDAGPHTPTVFVRSGSTNSAGTVTSALTSSYLFYDAIVPNDPNTSSAWTATGADNAQVGIIEG
jgi:hypothetical protein